jgi:hypothetical protein
MAFQLKHIESILYPSIRTPKKVDLFDLISELPLDLTNGPWIAGGFVRKLYHGIDISSGDVDIFDSSVENLTDIGILIKSILQSTEYTTQKSKYSMSYITEHYKIQLITYKRYRSLDELFKSFDFTICQYAYDGKKYKTGEHTIFDEKNKIIRLSHPQAKIDYSRLMKYLIYGYTPEKQIIDYINSNSHKLKFKVWNSLDDYEYI